MVEAIVITSRMSQFYVISAVATFILVLCNIHELKAQLELVHYGNTCAMAEQIVKDEVRNAFNRDPGLAAGLVRLQFHDCFIRGCDGSVLIDSTSSNTAEKDSPNAPGLQGFEVIDKAKARIEAVCRGVVSCADIVAFAVRDSIEMTGGLGYDVQAGRRDGRVSLASEASSGLTSPGDNLTKLTQAFAKRGLTQEDMVTLSGAHTIGRSHCTSFTYRLYNYNNTGVQDPSLDRAYAAHLQQECPQKIPTLAKLVVPMNPSSPAVTDAGYYMDVWKNRGMFNSDQTLTSSPRTANQVEQYAMNPMLWKSKFAAAMVKMGRIGVLTGSDGEIRANCRVIN